MPKNLSASEGLHPPDQGLCPWTLLGVLPPDILIGSRSVLAMCPHFQIASTAPGVNLLQQRLLPSTLTDALLRLFETHY